MTLKEARTLQAEIQGYGYHCTVPLGRGPYEYFCQIFGVNTLTRFTTRQSFRKHHAMRLRQRRQLLRQPKRDTRSPIDRMIDKACGLTP